MAGKILRNPTAPAAFPRARTALEQRFCSACTKKEVNKGAQVNEKKNKYKGIFLSAVEQCLWLLGRRSRSSVRAREGAGARAPLWG